MSRLPAPFPTRGRGGRLALEPDGIRRRRLGGIGGIELQPGLKIADALLQFSNPSVDGVQDGQEGYLGFRWDSVPERFGDGRLRDHAKHITKITIRKVRSVNSTVLFMIQANPAIVSQILVYVLWPIYLYSFSTFALSCLISRSR